MKIRLDVTGEYGANGRWKITSPDEPELVSEGISMAEVLRRIPSKLSSITKRRQKLSGNNRHSEHIASMCKILPEDYAPFGSVPRGDNKNCSRCSYKYGLESKGNEKLYQDWGICGNPHSHRFGLITHENQGCPHGVYKGDGKQREYHKSPHTFRVTHEPSGQIQADAAE